jgi:nicotinamide mononucleotide transporter
MQEIWQNFISGMLATTWLEFVAVVFGILSVVYSRAENILVYPTGLVNTTLYIYLSVQAGLYAEASVNGYYTIMSIAGWVWWARKKTDGEHQLCAYPVHPPPTGGMHSCFSGFSGFHSGGCSIDSPSSSVPLADGFAAASAYTGMWLMARKKLENWIWWIVTNIASIPLYFSKGFVFTSFQYLIFLVLAVMGYAEWRRKLAQSEVA